MCAMIRNNSLPSNTMACYCVPLELASLPGFHVSHIPKGNLVLPCTWYKIVFFAECKTFSLPAAGLFSRSWLRGTQGTRPYTTVQVWVPAGLHDACSGCSKSRNLASNHGIAFRPGRANQAHVTPQNIFVYVSPLLLVLKYYSSR